MTSYNTCNTISYDVDDEVLIKTTVSTGRRLTIRLIENKKLNEALKIDFVSG